MLRGDANTIRALCGISRSHETSAEMSLPGSCGEHSSGKELILCFKHSSCWGAGKCSEVPSVLVTAHLGAARCPCLRKAKEQVSFGTGQLLCLEFSGCWGC